MENTPVRDRALSTASTQPIVRPDGASKSHSNSLISKVCDGTFTQRKTVALAFGVVIAVVFATVGGVLGRSIASRPKISQSEMSICSSSPRLVIADDNSTGTLRGVRACGRRAWDSEETGSHMVYLSERENCLLQEEGAELHIPLHTHLLIDQGGNISQGKSSTLKFVTNFTETDGKNNGNLRIYSSMSVSGPTTITVHEAKKAKFSTESLCDNSPYNFEFCSINIYGNVTIEGSLTISSEGPAAKETSSLLLDLGTLEQNPEHSFSIEGNLKISKGAVLRLEGLVCYSSKGIVKNGKFRTHPAPANITLEGEDVLVKPDLPYRTTSGVIECLGN